MKICILVFELCTMEGNVRNIKKEIEFLNSEYQITPLRGIQYDVIEECAQCRTIITYC